MKLGPKLILFASLAATGAADHLSPTRQSERRHSMYVQLSEQIYPISLADNRWHPEFKWPSKEKERQIRWQLHNLVREEIGAVLANTEARDNVLKKAVVALQGASNLGGAWPRGEGGNVPFVQSFELDGIPTLAVGYSVAFGGLAIPSRTPTWSFIERSTESGRSKPKVPLTLPSMVVRLTSRGLFPELRGRHGS